MNQFKLAPRTSPSLDEAAIVLSSEEVDILIEAMLWLINHSYSPFEAMHWLNSGPDEAYALRERLVAVRDSGIYGGASS